jgi:hypothetical protein
MPPTDVPGGSTKPTSNVLSLWLTNSRRLACSVANAQSNRLFRQITKKALRRILNKRKA